MRAVSLSLIDLLIDSISYPWELIAFEAVLCLVTSPTQRNTRFATNNL